VSEPLGLFELTLLCRTYRLHAPHDRDVVAVGLGSERALRLVQVADRIGRLVAVRDRGVGTGDVGAGEVQRVLGRLEQGDGPPEVLERELRLRLLEREPPERPQQAYALVRVGHVVGSGGELGHDRPRALKLPEVGEGVAEVGTEASLRREILRSLLHQLAQAALEELDRAPRRAAVAYVWPRSGRRRAVTRT
jgi:hypothetical protein